MTRNPKTDPAAELTLAARPMAVIWIGACDGQPCRAWGDGIRVELCPAEPRRVRRALMSSPSWCVIGEAVDDRQVRDVILERLTRRYAAEGGEAGYRACARLLASALLEQPEVLHGHQRVR